MSKKDELFKDSRKKGYYAGFDDLKAQLVEGEEAEEENASSGEGEAPSAPSTDNGPDGQASAPAASDREKGSEGGDEERPTQRLNLEIDKQVHRQFKGVVGMRGLTMTEVIEAFMRDYVDRARRDLL